MLFSAMYKALRTVSAFATLTRKVPCSGIDLEQGSNLSGKVGDGVFAEVHDSVLLSDGLIVLSVEWIFSIGGPRFAILIFTKPSFRIGGGTPYGNKFVLVPHTV